MRLHKFLALLLTGSLFFSLTTLASADDPPPGEGSFEPMPIRPGKLVVDPSTGDVIQVELFGSSEAISANQETAPVIKQDNIPPISLQLAGSRTYAAAGGLNPNDLLLGRPAPGGVNAAASTYIKIEDFETGFPNAGWTQTGNLWDDVNCHALSGSRAAWPATDVVNPCLGNNYPDGTSARMVYGPFNLADAKSASLDFFFRMDSESCNPITNCDYLFVGASTDNLTFLGDFYAGSYTSGPFIDGYNFISFDLNNFIGQSQVWIRFTFVSNINGVTGQGPFIDLISLRKNTDTRVFLTNENFEVTEFPNSAWESFDLDGPANGEFYWDDVKFGQGGFNCIPRSGTWSLWPADNGANALNACGGSDYGNNTKSWIVHGPFSLVGASEAWVDFYFRNQSEPGFDFLFWGASVNGSNFFGPNGISGTQINGPQGNGYNLMRFNLSNVFTLGDLRGQPAVWLAFIFESDSTGTDKGPFIDDVSVVVEKTIAGFVYLPVVIKSPPPTTPKTSLFINNQTGGVIASYRVFSPKLNGAPIPDIVCTNIPAGATSFNCNATFDAGTYKVSSTNTCNPPTTSGQVTFKPGNDVRLVRCIN
ncbi:MAG: hypothetical protein BroJett011_05040 [Chloroflexota bacterium]|nr:MAG: hypothetical protein BroJett011_05040 [Chloroflexota bacterium]